MSKNNPRKRAGKKTDFQNYTNINTLCESNKIGGKWGCMKQVKNQQFTIISGVTPHFKQNPLAFLQYDHRHHRQWSSSQCLDCFDTVGFQLVGPTHFTMPGPQSKYVKKINK